MDHTSDNIYEASSAARGRWARLAGWMIQRLPVRRLLDALALAVLTAAVFGIAFYGFVRLFTEPRLNAVVGYMAANMGGLADAYEHLPEAQRPAFLEAVTAHSHGRMVSDDPARWGEALAGDGLVGSFVVQLRDRLPPGRLAMTRAPEGTYLWLALPAPGGGWHWLRVPLMPDAPRWSLVSFVALGLLAVVGAFGSSYLAWRLRRRVGHLQRSLQRLGPAGLRMAPQAAPSAPSAPAAAPPPATRFAADPQPHLEALAARLAHATRERAALAAAVAGDLRHGLVQLAGSEPLMAAPDATRCVQRVQAALGQLDSIATLPGQAPVERLERSQGRWRGLVEDLLMVAGLFGLAIVLSAVAVLHNVVVSRTEGAMHLMETVTAGIHATYTALPPDQRGDYLRSLPGYSGGVVQVDDPARWRIEEPVLWFARAGAQRIRAFLPELEFRTSPMPESFLWVKLDARETAPIWLRVSAPMLRSLQSLSLVGLAVLALAVAAVVVLQAQRRMVWFSLSLDVVDPLAPRVPPLQEEAPQPDATMQGLLRDLQQATGALARDHDREELALAHLAGELGEALEALRESIPHAVEAPGTADRLAAMRKRVTELDVFARRRQAAPVLATDLNDELRGLRGLLVDRSGPPLLWVLGGVPLVDIPQAEVRRLFLYLLDEVVRHGDAPIEVSTSLDASRIVLAIVGHGHGPSSTSAAGDAVGLSVVRRIVEANGGMFQLEPSADGGLRAQVWLRPARVA